MQHMVPKTKDKGRLSKTEKTEVSRPQSVAVSSPEFVKQSASVRFK